MVIKIYPLVNCVGLRDLNIHKHPPTAVTRFLTDLFLIVLTEAKSFYVLLNFYEKARNDCRGFLFCFVFYLGGLINCKMLSPKCINMIR